MLDHGRGQKSFQVFGYVGFEGCGGRTNEPQARSLSSLGVFQEIGVDGALNGRPGAVPGWAKILQNPEEGLGLEIGQERDATA